MRKFLEYKKVEKLLLVPLKMLFFYAKLALSFTSTLYHDYVKTERGHGLKGGHTKLLLHIYLPKKDGDAIRVATTYVYVLTYILKYFR